MEQNLKEINDDNVYNNYNNNGEDKDSQLDLNEQSYQKLKYLIEIQ